MGIEHDKLDELQCLINADWHEEQLLADWLSQTCGWEREEDTLVVDDTSVIEIRRSGDFDAEKRKEFPTGMSFFSHRVEFYSLAPHRDLVARVLEALWDRGVPATAACDFEDDLPHKGGFRSPEVPWPAP